MKKIVLISCVKTKLPHKAKAKDLFISPLFRYKLDYARQIMPDEIFVLSSKYGLLELEQEVEPYDVLLNGLSEGAKQEWAKAVLEQLAKRFDLKKDHFIFLASIQYRKYLIKQLPNHEVLFEGLKIGEQLSDLKNRTS